MTSPQPGSSRQGRKRLSPIAESGPGVKRSRVEIASSPPIASARPPLHPTSATPARPPTCCTSSPQAGVSDGTLSSLSVSPISILPPRRNIRKRNTHIDQRNCLQNRLRTARTQTDLYQETQHAYWGVAGIATNAVADCLPSPPRHQPVMSSCTHCYCELQRSVGNTQLIQLCVLCAGKIIHIGCLVSTNI